MLRVFCSALSPLLPDLGVELLLEPPPLLDPPEEELPEEDDFEEEEEDEPLPSPLVLDPEPPPFLVPVVDEEEFSVGVVSAGAVLVPGAAAPGAVTEITCAGTVDALPPPARPISTPTPIASSSTPTPATAVAPDERPPAAAAPPPPLAGAGPETVAGVKRLRNWLRACTWRPPHSRQ
jgi:hypothetical protein